jgi:microcystin-dependent protein
MSAPVLTANSPSAGYIAWTAFNIQYLGVSYAIPAGNSNKKYTWWPFNGGAGGSLLTSDTFPSTLTDDDLLLFLNRSGIPVNAQSADVLYGDLMVPGSILATAIGAQQITVDKLQVGDMTNVVKDPTMDNLGTWSLGSGWAFSATAVPAPNDNNATVMRYTANGLYSQNSEPSFPVQPGDKYALSYYIRFASALSGSGNVGVFMFFYDSSGSLVTTTGSDNATASITSAWALQSREITVPANAKTAIAVVRATAGITGGQVDVDQIRLYRKYTGDLLVNGSVTALTLSSQLELATHIIAPMNSAMWDWLAPSVTPTAGASATTGGTVLNRKYIYWVSAILPTGLATSPVGLTVDLTSSGTTTNTQVINWAAVTGATGYRIWRRDASVGGTDQTQTVGAVTTFTDTGAGWVNGSRVTTWSQARVDVASGGITQMDFDGNTTTSLSNDGGASFYQQTTYKASKNDSNMSRADRVYAPPAGSNQYQSSILLDVGHTSGNITKLRDVVTGYEQLTITGPDSISIGMYSDSSGHTGPSLLQIYGPDSTGATGLDCDDTGKVNLKGRHITIGDSASDITIPGVMTASGSGAMFKGFGAVPVGAVAMWLGATAPTGWMLMQGQSLSTTFYADLFAILGYTYGGSGTSFNLPDMTGLFPMGVSGTHARGTSGGSETHVLAVAELPSHNHSVGTLATNTTGSAHNHPYDKTNSATGSAGSTVAAGTGTVSANSTGMYNPTSAGTHTHDITGSTGFAGTGTAMSILNPFLAVNFIVYVGK